MALTLKKLIEDLPVTARQGSLDITLTELTDDSRQVQPGSLFIARVGEAGDGHNFLADAVQRGAAAILTDPLPEPPPVLSDHPNVAWLTADQVDQALCGELAERFFDRPGRKLRLVGVTGTNGKTTTAFALQHLLRTADIAAGLIGTVVVDDGLERTEAGLTTPGAIDFSRLLKRMVDNGCQAAVCEVSSHALEQKRTDALPFDVGVFTNLTGDHLDYHGTMEAYAAAKARLFEQLSPRGWAIINAEDPHAQRMVRDARCRVIWTTTQPPASGAGEDEQSEALWARAQITKLAADHSRARFDGPWGRFNVRLPLVGRHNVVNALQAAAAANVLVAMSRHIKRGLASCPNIPGRLEVVTANWQPGGDQPRPGESAPPTEADTTATVDRPSVLVDYAHTHDALENVLLALGPVTQGELIVVFGCGGDRDPSKRPKMADVAGRLADRVYVTSDNPRGEDPDAIIRQIMAGIPARRRRLTTVLPDRAEAIAAAIGRARPTDTVLIAGKGHETYQIVGETTHHFDDREQAAAALAHYRAGVSHI
jgi:UDP-N-acetylmuramoyl-L-alanyl-D-glutamate--2,6-diaminopimelate ligase